MIVNKPEIVTQKRIINLFKNPDLLGYTYLGDLKDEENNREYLISAEVYSESRDAVRKASEILINEGYHEITKPNVKDSEELERTITPEDVREIMEGYGESLVDLCAITYELEFTEWFKKREPRIYGKFKF